MKRLACLFIVIVASAAAQQKSFSQDMLQAHNAVRARVNVGDLVWSAKLAAYAQRWANSLLAAGKLKHRDNNPYGENLYIISGERATPREVVRIWSSEPLKDYNHHTQIVWKDTKEVGCAIARNARREVYVCNYNPPGNVVGQRPY
jgi:pathogenesis-related protein 1